MTPLTPQNSAEKKRKIAKISIFFFRNEKNFKNLNRESRFSKKQKIDSDNFLKNHHHDNFIKHR